MTTTLLEPAAPATIPFMRTLGRTGLDVSCLGIGGGGGISSADVLYAFDRGINYFFFSSDLHHFRYTQMAQALRTLCGRGSAQRERVVLAMVTYVKSPEMVFAALYDQFAELGIDYVDVFFWGWLGRGDGDRATQLFERSADLRGPGTLPTRFVEDTFGASERLRSMGAVRYVGASFHDHALAERWINRPELDVAMVRHNIAHRGAQDRVFAPAIQGGPMRPGIVTFKSQEAEGPLAKDRALPAGCVVPDAGDRYRYSLSQPAVDVCLTGPRTRSDIDGALHAVTRGYLTRDEMTVLERYGDHAHA